MSLQSALGLLLLEHPPRATNEKTYGEQRPKSATVDAWTQVLASLPADAFDPSAPLDGGDPWMFHLLRAFNHEGSATEAVDFLVNRYGPMIFEVRNQAGQSLIEKVFEVLVSKAQAAAEKNDHYKVERVATLWAYLLERAPWEFLALPEDAGQPPGTAWLERYLKQVQPAMPDRSSANHDRPDVALLGRGVKADAQINGRPLAAWIQDAEGLNLFLAHGLDPGMDAGNPLMPGQRVADLLSQRHAHMKEILNKVCPPSSVSAKAPSETDAMKALLGCSTKPEVRSALYRLGDWEDLETVKGVPAIWVAIQGSTAILTDLQRPRFIEQTLRALKRVDQKGRSPYYHLLEHAAGLDRGDFLDSPNGWFVQSSMPSPDGIVTADGKGLYLQAMDEALDHAAPDSYSTWSAIEKTRTSKRAFDALSHEQWWGTSDAQQQMARRLVNRLANQILANPQGSVDAPPLPTDLRGDVQRLHPELKAAWTLYHVVNKVQRLYSGCLNDPLTLVPEPWSAQDPMPVHSREALDVIRRALDAAMQHKQRLLEVSPSYGIKEKLRNELLAKQKASKPHWKATEARWRALQAQFLAVDKPQERSRPRMRH